MHKRRERLVIVALFATLLVLALLARPSADRSSTRDRRATTFRVSPYGAAALYELMRELDIPAERQLRPWVSDSAPGALALLGISQPLLPAEQTTLRRWIAGGGALIYAVSPVHDGLAEALGLQLVSLRPDTLGSLATVQWEGMNAYPFAHTVTRGIDSIAGFATGFAATPLLASDSVTVLMRAEHGTPVVVELRLGEGSVLAWSDVDVLTNQRLRDGGAALLFARFASAAVEGGGTVRFDEYHHGYREGSIPAALWRFVSETGPGRALLQLAAAAALLLLLLGARFGAPVVEHVHRRRSPLEHVDALAGAYRRGRAHAAARRLLLTGLERRLGRRIFETRHGVAAARLAGTDAGRRLRDEWERGEYGDLVDLAAAVDDYVREVSRWRQVP